MDRFVAVSPQIMDALFSSVTNPEVRADATAVLRAISSNKGSVDSGMGSAEDIMFAPVDSQNSSVFEPNQDMQPHLGGDIYDGQHFNQDGFEASAYAGGEDYEEETEEDDDDEEESEEDGIYDVEYDDEEEDDQVAGGLNLNVPDFASLPINDAAGNFGGMGFDHENLDEDESYEEEYNSADYSDDLEDGNDFGSGNDFGGLNLGEGGFGDMDLGGSDFGGSNMGGGMFGGMNLGGSDFGGSNMEGGMFGGMNLGGSDFGGSNIGGGGFGGMDYGSQNFGGDDEYEYDSPEEDYGGNDYSDGDFGNGDEFLGGSADFGGAGFGNNFEEESEEDDYDDEEEESEEDGESMNLQDLLDEVNKGTVEATVAHLEHIIETGDLPLGSDIEMIEALLAHMQQNQVAGGGSQIYDDLQDDDDEDDYDDDDEDDDEDDYYAAAGGGDQVPIGMYQNPFGGGDEASADMMQGLGMQGLQSLLAMGNPGGDMGGMVGGMDGHSGGIDVSSFLPNNVASVGAAFMSAAGGLMDGLGGGHGGGHGGVSIKEYDEEDEEELTESESEEDLDVTDDEDERHHMSGMGQMAAAMGGLVMGGAGVAALAGMMNPNQQHMGGPQRGHPMMSPPHHGGAPSFLNMGHGMNGHPQMTQNPSYSTNNMSPPQSSSGGNMVAAAAASVAAAAAALMPKSSQHQSHHPAALGAPSHMGNPNHMNIPNHMEAPSHINPSSHLSAPNQMSAPSHMNAPPTIQNSTPTTLSPPMSISSNLGGGTMSRVDPLAALSAVGAAGAITAGVVGKMVSQTSSGGGTAIVKRDDHINRVMSSSTNKPPTIHKSMDELNKLSDSLAMTRIASSQVGGYGMAQSVQNLMPPHSQHQTLPHGHPHSMLQQQFMLPGMMMRPPMPNCQPGQIPQQKRLTNDGDKTSLDGEFVPGSFGSGGGKSDTESNQSGKKPSISLGPGRVSPDSSSGSSSTSGRHAKNSSSLASLSDLPSATESMRDSDTDNLVSEHHLQMQNYHRQMQMEHNNGLRLPGPLPLLLETPGYGWSSLVGHENAKEALKNIFIGKNFPEVFDAQGSCRGVLLFGPSGAGKTSLARSLAYEAGGAKLIACASQYVITNPQRPEHAALLVRNMFDHARVQKPCVMLLDDIELFAHPELSEHGRCARAELMAQVRGESTIEPGYPENTRQFINDHVMLVATTCSPWMLPEELRRLFAYNIHIKLPGEKQREELFRMFLNNSANNVTGDQYKCIISKSEGYSAADIHTVVRQASYNPSTTQGGGDMVGHHNLPRVVTFDDLGSVMTNYRCLYKPEHLEFYRRYIQEATHKTDEKSARQSKPKGVKKLGSKVARTFMAVLSVID